MNNIIIRVATKKDLPHILQLHKELALKGEKELSLSRAGKIFDKIRACPDYKIYVTSMKGKIVGTFALLIMDNLAHKGAPSAIVEDVAVAPEFQGLGIGKKMMHFAMDLCRKKKCYKLILSSNKKRVKAHQFYKSLGFAMHGYSFLIPL